jgi:hypothetical protein
MAEVTLEVERYFVPVVELQGVQEKESQVFLEMETPVFLVVERLVFLAVETPAVKVELVFVEVV